MIDIGGPGDQIQVEPFNINESIPLRKNSNVLLDDWNWRREEVDTELGYFYDAAWEKDPFTGKKRENALVFIFCSHKVATSHKPSYVKCKMC